MLYFMWLSSQLLWRANYANSPKLPPTANSYNNFVAWACEHSLVYQAARLLSYLWPKPKGQSFNLWIIMFQRRANWAF